MYKSAPPASIIRLRPLPCLHRPACKLKNQPLKSDATDIPSEMGPTPKIRSNTVAVTSRIRTWRCLEKPRSDESA